MLVKWRGGKKMEPSKGGIVRRLDKDIKEVWDELEKIKSDIEDIREEIKDIKSSKQPTRRPRRHGGGRGYY
jgi:predicted transcriptional regulator